MRNLKVCVCVSVMYIFYIPHEYLKCKCASEYKNSSAHRKKRAEGRSLRNTDTKKQVKEISLPRRKTGMTRVVERKWKKKKKFSKEETISRTGRKHSNSVKCTR